VPFYDDSLDPGNPTLRWVQCARTVPSDLYQDEASGEFLLRLKLKKARRYAGLL
jgi:hypothetical protein